MKLIINITIISVVFIVLVFVFFIKTQRNNISPDIQVPDTDIITEVYPKYGHADDFSWVSGKLKYQSLEGGCWTLIFSQNQETDDFNGIFALGNAENYDLKDGEFVVVEGKVSGSKFSMACPPNIYQIVKIHKD